MEIHTEGGRVLEGWKVLGLTPLDLWVSSSYPVSLHYLCRIGCEASLQPRDSRALTIDLREDNRASSEVGRVQDDLLGCGGPWGGT